MDILPPPQAVKHPFRIGDMLEELGGWQYASKGRYCLYHILKALHIKGPVGVPIYCCDSILQPIRELGLQWYCYDICLDDLNADVDSVLDCINKYHVDCVIAVSMYGNPCQLDKLEELCQIKNVKLIDDAAQSFGAILNGRRVGFFGDAGFFSFSPGKPLAGHLGGAFRVKCDYSIRYKSHLLIHYLAYMDFIYNRCKEHYSKNIKGKMIKYTLRAMFKMVSIKNDRYSRFEEGVLYGIYKDSLYIHNPYRAAYVLRMAEEIKANKFRVLRPYDDYRKGVAHKYILICETKDLAKRINSMLQEREIMSQLGYRMLCDTSLYDNARKVDGCIVEIPLNACEEEYNYVKLTLNELAHLHII